MNADIPQPDLHQDCLNKLSRVLDLVLKTAEAASADNNHKIVIQSAREAARLAALIHKMTNQAAKNAHSTTPDAESTAAGAASRTSSRSRWAGKQAPNPEELILPDLDGLFPPGEVASWDQESQELYKGIAESYQKMQAIGAELADSLTASDHRAGAGDRDQADKAGGVML